MARADDAGQLPLLAGSAGPRPRARPQRTAAALSPDRPIARVAVLTPLPHLDRPFDYAVPAGLAAAAEPGARVRVRLAGRPVDGFILERVDTADTDRTLQPLRSVHGPPVLTPAIARLCREVADRYAGTFADVVRAAVPPRHARVEARLLASTTVPRPDSASRGADGGPFVPEPAGWPAYRGGRRLLDALGSLPGPRISWCSGPGEDIPVRVAELARITAGAGRGVLVIAADDADVSRLTGALEVAGLTAVDLTARTGPQARYRAFLRVLLGDARVVVGTRGAVFSPVHDLGLLAVLDDADESLGEPHAPGWHAREVAALRAAGEGTALVLAGPSVSLETERMVAVGWLGHVDLPRTTLRSRTPRIEAAEQAAGGDPARAASRIPSVAIQVMREAAQRGPVLVSVARAGYLPALLCQTCREQVLCPQCAAPVRADGPGGALVCERHGPLPPWRCPQCGGTRLRAAAVGVRRTAEEFGRALPGVPVVTSSAENGIVRTLTQAHGVVVATTGAEPDPGPGRYAALVLLDVAAALSRPGLRVAEEVLRRWLQAASLVRPAPAGGRVLVVGDEGLREVQALIRWDPRGYAQRELDERLSLALPPAVRTARLVGPALAVSEVADRVADSLGHRLVRRSGPLPAPASPRDRGVNREPAPGRLDGGSDDDRATWVLGVALADGPALAGLLREVQAQRSVHGAPVVSVRMDPVLP